MRSDAEQGFASAGARDRPQSVAGAANQLREPGQQAGVLADQSVQLAHTLGPTPLGEAAVRGRTGRSTMAITAVSPLIKPVATTSQQR
ncbi:hypothetical protein [Streptomyces murinus]|uniref:hypothetical protein n=1 Tax=Streptomyces murinus TaxID=33900 RepID=UPI003812C975